MRAVRYAIRRLLATPTFTVAASLTLAIAIGATASVFGLVDGVLLKAFPYRDPDRVLDVWESSSGMHVPKAGISVPDYLDFRAHTRSFAGLAASNTSEFTVTGPGESERVTGYAVTPSYFSVLGLTPTIGRPLASDSSGPAEVVIGYGYCLRHFGGASSALGRSLRLNDRPYTIVGVMPPGVPAPIELWTRLSFGSEDWVHERDWHLLRVYGRLEPGVTAQAARAELQTAVAQIAQGYPQSIQGWVVQTIPLLNDLVGNVRLALVVLLAAASCVLLIGAANLANLFLVRGLARQREIAVRTALGATRARLVRELFAEAAILGVVAGAVGAIAAAAGIRTLSALAPPTLPRVDEIAFDWRTVVFCAVASVVALLVFGVLPASQVSRGHVAQFLKEGARGTGSAGHRRLQNGLVVLQVAVAFVLLAGAGLLVKTFERFMEADPGFRPEHILSAQIALSYKQDTTAAGENAVATRIVSGLAAVPGIVAASGSSALPGGASTIWPFAVVGDPAPEPGHELLSRPVLVTPDYFRTMGIVLRRGRAVLPTDDRRAIRIGVVDERLADRFLGGSKAIGRRIVFRRAPETDTVEIVGVVPPVEQGGLVADDHPVVYLPLAQAPAAGYLTDIAVRASGDPAREVGVLKRVVAAEDATAPVFDVKTMQARLVESVGTTRFASFLASLFAVVALILGVVGVYSVLAYIVTQRTREIALRMALGAGTGRVVGGILGPACWLVGMGLALGSFTAWVVTRVLSGLFVGVSPHDPAIFVGAAGVFAAVALAAASVPAFRTTRVNPVVALTSM